jgi:hypothetical protein
VDVRILDYIVSIHETAAGSGEAPPSTSA